MTSAAEGMTIAGPNDAVVDVEFEVIADDIHAVGRAMTSGRRVPTLPHAIVLVGIATVFWWLGNPIGAAILAAFAIVVYTNPRIGFLDRWWAKRLPGNRIGSRWRIWAGVPGIGYSSDGVSGHVDWHAVESLIVAEEAMVVMGSNSSLLVSIPRRAMTPWQVAAMTDLATTHAPGAKLIR